MSNKLNMVDLSSNNSGVNLKALWDAGFRVLTLKVSEGTSYAWGDSHRLAAQWHSFGGIVGHYHFLHPGSPQNGVAQADWFWNHVRHDLGVGDFLVVDVETHGETNAEVAAFINRVHDHSPNIRGLIYGPEYFLRDDARVTPTHGWGVWLADYSGKVDFVPRGWPTWDVWQYTQSGRVPGVSGNVDISHIRRALVEPTLHYGDSSFAVVDAKKALRKAGFGGFATYSQKYGFGLRRAVTKFKKKHGYSNTSGNVLGSHVWTDLRKYL